MAEPERREELTTARPCKPGPGSIFVHLCIFLFLAIVVFRVFPTIGDILTHFSVVYFLLVLITCIVAHELGHALAARAVGWEVYLIGVGPFVLRCRPLAIRKGWVFPGRRIWGFTHVAPNVRERWTKLRAVAVYAGGSGMNLTLAAVVFGCERFSNSTPSESALALTGTLSLAIGVMNLVPFRLGRGTPSDGAKILELIRKRTDYTSQEFAVSKLGGLFLSGVNPRDWDESIVREISTSRNEGEIGGRAELCC